MADRGFDEGDATVIVKTVSAQIDGLERVHVANEVKDGKQAFGSEIVLSKRKFGDVSSVIRFFIHFAQLIAESRVWKATMLATVIDVKIVKSLHFDFFFKGKDFFFKKITTLFVSLRHFCFEVDKEQKDDFSFFIF